MAAWTTPHYCVECDEEMRPRSSPPDGRPRHDGRGLCGPCYQLAGDRANGVKPKPYLSVFADDYATLRSLGLPPRVMAERLGMTFKAFERKVFRAKRAGYPEVQNYTRRAA